MRTCVSLAFLAVVVIVLTGCKPKCPLVEPIPDGKDYERPLADGKYALRKLPDDQVPDFTIALTDRAGLKQAAMRSLSYLAKPSSRSFFPYATAPGESISHDIAVASLNEFVAMLDSPDGAARMNQRLKQKFDVYMSVGCDDAGAVLFTGYYTPIFDASPVRTDRFTHPIYRQPDDLVKGFGGEVLGQKCADGAVRRYPERRQIEQSNMLSGLELYWLGDPFEVYIAHVQGSAILRMPDGKLITVGYSANNGHEYQSVGKAMVADGKLPKDKISLQGMIDYFRSHPQEVQSYTWKNPRFVFFTAQLDDDSPRGSLNEPVTTMRSIATDKAIFPRAGLTFIAAPLPRRVNGQITVSDYSGFAFDQDTGGAIRAPGRCDVYMGIGQEASALAGRTYTEGRLYYLFLKPNIRLQGQVTVDR